MATKTIIPGMSVNDSNSPQNQSNSSAPKQKSTVYPGMNMDPSAPKKGPKGNDKPIMGFLFSVSRTALGEYWPLYVGPNTIGRNASNSICLSETSVSDNHATIVIRQMQNNGVANGIFVFVQDIGSTCGTMLNGSTLGFNPEECHSGDIITIGMNYELYLILVDPVALGLAPKAEFSAASSKVDAPSPAPGWVSNEPVGLQTGGQPKGTLPGGPGFSPFDGPSTGGQSNPFNDKKATMYMPNKK